MKHELDAGPERYSAAAPLKKVEEAAVGGDRRQVTEPQYLKRLLSLFRATAVDVVALDVKPSKRKDPAGLAREAIRMLKQAQDPYGECWCLVDVDEHESLGEACAAALSAEIHLVISNPCFEIWLYWHYRDLARHVQRGNLSSLLEGHRHSGKELPPAFPYLDWEKAKARARMAAPGARLNVVGPNPSSLVGDLVEAMKAGGR